MYLACSKCSMKVSFSFSEEERATYVFPQKSGLKKKNCILPGKWSSLLLPGQGYRVKETELEEKRSHETPSLPCSSQRIGHIVSTLSEPLPQLSCPMFPSFLHYRLFTISPLFSVKTSTGPP